MRCNGFFYHSEALDMHLAVGILRTPEKLDYSTIIEEKDKITLEKLQEIKKENKIPRNQSERQLSQGKFIY